MSELFDALAPALADRYTLERELGHGGMATVFLAGDVKHRRKVAIKVLHPEIAAAIGPDRFLREIEIAAQLQHPHILPLYDSGEAAGYLYYVMPFVEGESLRDRLNRERQLPQEDVIKITSEVASALGYAHSRGIVHRDIKPENIMLTGGSAIVADFGIARAASAVEQQQLTQTGTVIGTPLYMSPEQSTGSEVDGRSDEYSLACVVYEMLVGEPPFTGPNVQSIIARHSMAAVSPPSIIRVSIPETMEMALLKALEKVPADRFPTVIMFAEAMSTPSHVSAANRRLSTTAIRTVSRPSVTLQLPVPSWRQVARWAIPVLLVLLVAAWGVRRLIGPKAGVRSTRVAMGADPRRIAVLYFDVRSFDAGGTSTSLEYLADGLTEALIHELSQVQKLQVVSSNGVRLYKGTKLSPDSIGRALKVGTLVEGTVAQSGDRLRVSVSLVNAGTGEEVGSTTLEQPRADLFALQDTLAKAVSIALRQRLGEEIQVQETRAGTKNVAAWELTQQGQEIAKSIDALLAVGDTTAAAKALGRADSILAQAQSLDRGWVTPLVARGWLAFKALSLVGTFDKTYYERHLRQALDFAGQALKLRPDYPDALTLRGTMRSWAFTLNLPPEQGGDVGSLAASAEQDLSAAVAADPNQAPAWAELSFLLMRDSRTSEAKLAALHAYEADPYLSNSDKVLWRLFQSSLDLDDGVEAKRWCQEGGRRFPADPRFVECQLWLFALRGQKPDIKAAWQLLDSNVALYPPNERDFRRRRGQFLVAMALVRAGLPDSARAVALRSRADATIDPVREFVYIEAVLRTMLGDRDEALRLLTTYLATNPQDRASLAKDDTWWWAGLRDDPRFKKLVGLAS